MYSLYGSMKEYEDLVMSKSMEDNSRKQSGHHYVVSDTKTDKNNVEDAAATCTLGKYKLPRPTAEIVILLYFLAFSAGNSLQPQFVYSRISEDNGFVKDISRKACAHRNHTAAYTALENKVQAESSNFNTILTVAHLIPAVVTTLFLGHWSDFVGRRMLMLLSITGSTLMAFTMLLVSATHASLYWLVLGSLIDALTGGTSGIIVAVYTYISDITTAKNRTLRMVLIEAGQGIGMLIATSSTGYAIRNLGYTYACLIMLSGHALNAIYILFFLKESLRKKKDAVYVSLFSMKHLVSTKNLLFCGADKRRMYRLWLCMGFLGIFFMVKIGCGMVTTLYLLGQPLCFDSVEIGLYSALSVTVEFFGGAMMMKVLIKCFGGVDRDSLVLIWSAVGGVAANILMGFALSPVIVIFVPVVSILVCLGMPLVRSIASKMVARDEQGALFAGLAPIQQIMLAIGASLFNTIFAQTVDIYQGFVFFVCAVMFVIPLVLAILIHRHIKKEGGLQPEELKNHDTPDAYDKSYDQNSIQ